MDWVDLPEAMTSGRQTLTFTVTNVEAGHTLPTSDVERHLQITARALDDAGNVLGTRMERIGTLYKWFPKTERVEDTRLSPRETRAFTLEFDAPARGNITLSLHGTNNRISPENFAWHKLEGDRWRAGCSSTRARCARFVDGPTPVL